MDLTKFTSPKKTVKKELLNTKDLSINTEDKNITYNFKTKEGLDKVNELSFFSLSTSLITDDEEKAQEFFEQSINAKVEGLMAKSLSSPYSSGLRSGAMAKLKEVKEDIDVVITAAEHGQGKRAGFYSSFYVAVKNENNIDENDEFLNIGKVASGIKELEDSSQGVTLHTLTKLLTPLKISEDKGITQFEPKIVIQIRYQEIQKSTTYSSGFALRFPRIIMLRSDKNNQEINSIEDLKHLEGF